MPRPRSLNPEVIVAAALAVIDRDGLDALSMRAVAGELRMGTMSLYRYVADRDGLESLVVERLLAQVDPRPPAGLSWCAELHVLVGRVRDAVGAHPAVIPLLLRRRHESAASRRWLEATLGALERGGFTGARRVIAQRTLVSYLLGALQTEYYGALSGAGTEALAMDDCPLIAQTARAAAGLTPEDEFGRGLAVVIAGLRSGEAP
ncbi:TetR/AcrR family transcriptional regulator C-terminal domain-containing protein [Pseudonocardia eucalypti]|uniref:TetR/AcrR family transcriptional regulator C-terminal domain-containing protein n=1 Tax=Pseudonocardia eucalypti TaxID=648755 RepID=A0ABP9Q4K4_9PSEU|nr:AcrR family transcriptional regulator [Pseudonocardia eucalypti]